VKSRATRLIISEALPGSAAIRKRLNVVQTDTAAVPPSAPAPPSNPLIASIARNTCVSPTAPAGMEP
jgi:hypothetical protein